MSKARKNRRGIVVSSVATVLTSVLYYLLFSWLFDTPIEHQLKISTEHLREHINELQGRYDTLEKVTRNLQQRDSAVFGIIFESTPYEAPDRTSNDIEQYKGKSLASLKRTYEDKLGNVSERIECQNSIMDSLLLKFATNVPQLNRIPSIQPINNPQLSLLATSYGSRTNPFFKNKTHHPGFDYAVPVGTAVFATADGNVAKVVSSGATTGTSVTIDHENGIRTVYAFLSRSSVKVGDRVRRGDIIAFTGNSGLSYAPHLHYEIQKDGKDVNPIDYLFLEIGPDKVEEFKDIASHAMQAFD